MDYNNINTYIEKYFEGKTSMKEESILKKYFKEEQIAPEHLAYKKLFDFYEEEASIKNPKPLGLEIYKKRNYKLAIAAVVILGFGAFSLLFNKNGQTKNQYVQKDSKKEIYKEVKKYSSDLNKGIRQISAFGFMGKATYKKTQKKDTLKK